MVKLAAIVLTKNEEQHIGECLVSLTWADRRVVFDSFSTDRTCEIAREHGAEVMQHPFADYASQRNAALQAVDAEWIFFVDADERATPELAEEITKIVVDSRPMSTMEGGPGKGAEIAGWYVPRHNYLFGQLTRGAGYWPDYQMRLLKRGLAHYDRPASEIVELEGNRVICRMRCCTTITKRSRSFIGSRPFASTSRRRIFIDAARSASSTHRTTWPCAISGGVT